MGDKANTTLTLSWWEEFIINAAVSLLGVLESKLTNPTELAALKAAIEFLQSLLGGSVAVVTGD
jgi:hypothetical protein